MKKYVFKCDYCQIMSECDYNDRPRKSSKNQFCSRACSKLHQSKQVEVPCGNCGTMIWRRQKEVKKSSSGLSFCSSKCSAAYHYQFRKRSRRSKCEAALYDFLKQSFPDWEILPNDKTMLGGLEVDIAIPSLNLAIEWNGIVHFKPIYGHDKLEKIQSRDETKRHIAAMKDINLIVVPDFTSSPDFVKNVCVEIRDIVAQLINDKTGC